MDDDIYIFECPPCPDCSHKHRASACVCGCQNKAWRNGSKMERVPTIEELTAYSSDEDSPEDSPILE